MEQYFSPEELANWDLESLEIESWLSAGDCATFEFSSGFQNIYLSLIRSVDGEPFCNSMVLSTEATEGELIVLKELNLLNPLPLKEFSEIDSDIESEIHERLSEWRTRVEDFSVELSPIAWIPESGSRIPDRPYVILSALFAYIQEQGSVKALEVCATLTGASYETTKSRIRYARVRGFLSKPGRGSSEKSVVTKLGIRKLKEEMGYEYS